MSLFQSWPCTQTSHALLKDLTFANRRLGSDNARGDHCGQEGCEGFVKLYCFVLHCQACLSCSCNEKCDDCVLTLGLSCQWARPVVRVPDHAYMPLCTHMAST